MCVFIFEEKKDQKEDSYNPGEHGDHRIIHSHDR